MHGVARYTSRSAAPACRGLGALARALAAVALLLLCIASALRRLERSPSPSPDEAAEAARLTAHSRARELLLRRNGTRLLFLVTSPAAREAACALSAAAGELLSPGQCPSAGAGRVGAAGAEVDVSFGTDDAAARCRALRASPYTALVLEADALQVMPFHDARARLVALLDDGGGGGGQRSERKRLRLRARGSDDAPVLRALGGAGAGAREALRGDLTQQHLQAAEDVLEAADAVLLASRLREGLPALARLGGWRFDDVSSDALLGPLQAQRRVRSSRIDALETALLRRADSLADEAASESAARREAARVGRFAPSASAPCNALPGAPLLHGPVPPGAGADAPGGSCGSEGVGEGVALCASLRDGAPFLAEWLAFHAAAGATRAYLHDDGSVDGTAAALDAWAAPHTAARGFVTPLQPLHGPPRFGIAQRSPAGGWSGQREVLARCLTHAILDGMCWLINPDLDEYAVPRPPHASLAAALAPHADAVCATVRRHAFNSNNASAVALAPPAASSAAPAALAATSVIARTFLRRWRVFPPAGRGMPRNPKWALRVPSAAAALAARGPHALALQVHNIWDRVGCSRCADAASLHSRGLVPEVDPCAGYYAAEAVKAAPEGRCTRNWCTGDTGAVAEDTLKLHHYVLPRGAKSYRRKGAGDAGARRDVWQDDVRDDDALRFAAPLR